LIVIDAASGQGGVAVFDESGTLINGSELAAPWGLALAPANFGIFSNDPLVGNFSFLESESNAFDPTTGMFLGTIPMDVARATPPAGSGGWSLAAARAAGAVRTSCTSTTVSTARQPACSGDLSSTGAVIIGFAGRLVDRRRLASSSAA